MTATWVDLNVDKSPMQTYVATPDGPGPFPAIVFAMHIGGVDECIRSYCDRLARAGYATASPDLYHRQDKGLSFEDVYSAGEDISRVRELVLAQAQNLKRGLLDDEMVRDMSAAADYLGSLPGVVDGGHRRGRFLPGWSGFLSHGDAEHRREVGRHCVWERPLRGEGRRPVPVRQLSAHHLPGAWPLRSRRPQPNT